MKNLNEGQTQVYMNGMVTPQYGVNTQASYLNTPPPQLMSIANEFFKSGKSPAQVIAILVGMGTPQQLAQSAVNVYVMQNPSTVMVSNSLPNRNPPGYPSPAGRIKNLNTLGAITEKNNNKMRFTLNNLYNKIQESLAAIDVIKSDESRISYSANNAKTLLESTAKRFPNLTLSQEILSYLSESEIDAIKEGKISTLDIIDYKINPNIKFGIANILFRESALYDWLDPIYSLRNYIKGIHTNNRWSFRLSEAVDAIYARNNPLDQRLAKDLIQMLNESVDVIEDKIIDTSKKNPWSREIAIISNEINETRKGARQGKVSVVRAYSPILVEGNSFIFHLNGKNYRMSGNKIREVGVADSRYLRVIESMSMFSKINNILTLTGKDLKTLEINLTEGTTKIGNTDFSGSNAHIIKEALMNMQFFNHRDLWKIDKVCSLVESLDMIVELDNFLTLSSDEFTNVFLTMISVDEGVWLNKVNASMRLNEIKFVNTASEALSETKTFIGYDATAYLSERLIKEGNETAKIQKRRDLLNKELSFLVEKKGDIELAIKRIGNVSELTEALGLITSEISKKEKDLQSTYISEKKTKTDYLNDGYVEATLKNQIQSLKKGQSILINAEEFASLGADDLIDVVDAKTTESFLVPKNNIAVSFN